MNGLKKQFIKGFLKLTILENKFGLLKIRMAKLSELDKKYKVYESYIITAMKLLNGIEDFHINYEENTMIIKYNPQIVTAEKVYNWVQTIIDVGIDHLEFIEKYGELQTAYVVSKLEELLKRRVQLFNK